MKPLQVSGAIASKAFYTVVFLVCAAATLLLTVWDKWKGDRYGI